jgi:hypothetical protein
MSRQAETDLRHLYWRITTSQAVADKLDLDSTDEDKRILKAAFAVAKTFLISVAVAACFLLLFFLAYFAVTGVFLFSPWAPPLPTVWFPCYSALHTATGANCTAPPPSNPLPKTPLQVRGRYLYSADGETRVRLRCVNWPGHMEAMIPEGLQHRPYWDIAYKIYTAGFNCVRLTYSIQMLNEYILGEYAQVIDRFGDLGLADIGQQVLNTNSWISGLTHIQVFDEIIRELGRQGWSGLV